LDTLAVHIDTLRGKAAALGQKVTTLAEENRILRNKMDSLSAALAGREEEIRELKQQFEILKMARSLNSGEAGDSKTEDLKRKINDYIKEIDQCLKLIGD
jgi:predicted  nucleic acid-binding Zn-ribbon protein